MDVKRTLKERRSILKKFWTLGPPSLSVGENVAEIK